MYRQIAPVVLLFAACQMPTVSLTDEAVEETAAQVAESGAVSKPLAQGQEKPKAAKDKAAELEKKRKELRTKERALAHAAVEHRIAAIDRRVKAMTVEAALVKSSRAVDAAASALDLFITQQKPRELEQHKIRVDGAIHRADHSKDELAELTAMYEADEFAKATKELVLKRGRRSLEMAERGLAVAKKELAEFESHTLPRRERELRDKLAEAELGRKKAGHEAEKVAIQRDLALQKEKEAVADLEEDIAKLQKELAGKGKS